MKWLVISDIHSAIHDFSTADAQKKLILQIKRERKTAPFDFLLITGDCMDRCLDSEQAEKYIISIMDACNIDRDHIFICPGNHDIKRLKPGESSDKTERTRIIKNLREGKCDIRKLSLEGSEAFPWRDAYSEFMDMYQNIKGCTYEPFKVFEPEGENYRILSIDSCLFSMDDFDAGNLYVRIPKLMEALECFKDDEKLNIAMMHHGVEFLEETDARKFENALADYNVDVLYCGHNHRTGMAVLADAIKIDEAISGHRVREFTCGACHVNDTVQTEAKFFVCEYSEAEHFIKTTAYHYASDISGWGLDSTSARPFTNGVNIYRIPRWYKLDDVEPHTLDTNLVNISDDQNRPVAVYENPNALDSRTKELIAGTEILYYMGIKGDQIYEDDYRGVARFISENKTIKAKFLLANPVGTYLEKRIRSLPAYQNELKFESHLRTLYRKGISLYDECENEPNWFVRYHNEPVLFKLYIFSQCLLIGYYTPGEHSKESTLYEYKAGSRMYNVFKLYFEEKWAIASKERPIIDVKHNFLKDEYEMVPTLVLNITDKCTFNCYYCPDGGENLHKGHFAPDDFATNDEIISLIDAYVHVVDKFVPKNYPVLRITGGEPFLNDDTVSVVHAIYKKAQQLKIPKIVVCSNGLGILDAYHKEKALWDSLKNNLWIKISLDTLKTEAFRQISRIQDYGILEKIKDAICELKQNGFLIELNTVLTQYNYSELEAIYDFACQLDLYGVKVFTINDFGGNVVVGSEDKLSGNLKKMIEEMIGKGKITPIKSEFLNQSAGIRMGMYTHDQTNADACTLKIVDHQRGSECITPDRTYGKCCDTCRYYKDGTCATGLMSLTMRADGLVSYCRLRMQEGFSIKDQNAEQIMAEVHEIMEAFKHCKHK